MKVLLVCILLTTCMTGCVTMSGSYRLTAVAKDGTPIRTKVDAQGSGIYAARSGICAAYPGATVSIADKVTGKELSSESPYKCR
jgi:hypothetical protein